LALKKTTKSRIVIRMTKSDIQNRHTPTGAKSLCVEKSAVCSLIWRVPPLR